MTTTRDHDYEALVDHVHATFVDRMKGYLDQVASHLVPGTGLLPRPPGVIDLSDEEYRYDLVVIDEDGQDMADVSVVLLEERVTEPDDHATRFAFSASAHEVGGIHIGTCAPFNFTEHLWVEAGEELEERWAIVEESADEMAEVLLEWACDTGATQPQDPR